MRIFKTTSNCSLILISSNMNFFINIICAFVLIGLTIGQTPLTTDEAAKIKTKAIADCRTNNKELTDEEVDDILVKRIGPKTKFGDCFIACILKACDYMAPNNTLIEKNLRDRLDRTKDQAPPEEYPKKLKILEVCKGKETPQTDECVAANKFVACVIAQRKELSVTTKLW